MIRKETSSNTENLIMVKKLKMHLNSAKLDVYKEFYEDDGTMKYEGGYINGMPVGTLSLSLSSKIHV